MATPDVTVMGAGIFGLACAWEMQRRGATVAVIETVGVGAGASGGVLGALAPHVPEAWNAKKQFQLDSLLRAASFWEDVTAAGGQATGYARTGRIQPVMDEAGFAQAQSRAESATAHWGQHAHWSVEPAEGVEWVLPRGCNWVIRDTLTARIAPRAALSALVAAIEAKGGRVMVGEGKPAGRVLWATGVHGLADLSAAFGMPVGRGEKGQAARLGFAAGEMPQLLLEGIHVVPHADGSVAVGSTSERIYSGENATSPALDDLVARVRALVPTLAKAPVIERWAGVRPRAASRAPLLGEWPGRPGHYIANGGFKIGFGMAPGVAGTMADLILEDRDRIPEGFRLSDCL